jgi:hypothetical protein
MRRRQVIFRLSKSLLLPAIAAPALIPDAAWAQSVDKVSNLSQALRWLDQLEAAPGVKTSGAWPLSVILEHLAQSIEMSLQGYPQPKSPLFQNTVGTAAFTIFKWRGQMSHSLSEPIPGAPEVLPALNWRPSAKRLHAAIERFFAHKGSLRPHFAYGLLGQSDYAAAHAMHIANHQDEIALHRFA